VIPLLLKRVGRCDGAALDQANGNGWVSRGVLGAGASGTKSNVAPNLLSTVHLQTASGTVDVMWCRAECLWMHQTEKRSHTGTPGCARARSHRAAFGKLICPTASCMGSSSPAPWPNLEGCKAISDESGAASRRALGDCVRQRNPHSDITYR